MCLLIMLFDWALISLKPLRFFDVTEFVPLDQNPLVEKLQSFLQDKTADPDVIVLGSSLMLFPSVRLDEQLSGKRHRYDKWFIRHKVSGHLTPRWFEQVTTRLAGAPVKIVNLGVQGSIVSDQYLILRKSLECGKKPSVVVLELAPRSFLDNMHKQIDNTPPHQVLADYTMLPDVFSRGLSITQLKAALPGMMWHYYKVRADYRELIANIFTSSLNRPMNDWEASHGIRRQPLKSAFNPEMEWESCYSPLYPKYHDLEMYQSIYNPPDEAFFRAEMADCIRLCELAAAHGTKLIIADMPVSEKNIALLSPDYLDRYRRFIDALGQRPELAVLRLSADQSFLEEDFEDSAHLNAAGGGKLFRALAYCVAPHCAKRAIAASGR